MFRFLEGIGNGFTVNETLNGKPKGATSEVWEGIRGGSAHACFSSSQGKQQVEITAYGALEESPQVNWKYQVAFVPSDGGRVTKECMEVGEYVRSFSWDSNSGLSHLDAAKGRLPLLRAHSFGVSNDDVEIQERSYRLPEDIRAEMLSGARSSRTLMELFSDVQRIDPAPDVLRNYAQSSSVKRMGDHGQNFAALVETICQDEEVKGAYLAWLRQLRPGEVDDVGTLSGALGEPMFALVENGRKIPAPVQSDGTLRFAALAASFFQPSMPRLVMIEEIENGIHASRVQLLMELIRTQAETRRTQVIATTHSATVLEWLQEDDYKTTFFCRRDESTGESRICSLADVPHFTDAVKNAPVSELFSEGWLEMAS